MKTCKSCSAPLVNPIPGQCRCEGCRCEGCQVDFEQWLRDESPAVYKPRRDGVWRGPEKD
jgi:hypothetical protein